MLDIIGQQPYTRRGQSYYSNHSTAFAETKSEVPARALAIKHVAEKLGGKSGGPTMDHDQEHENNRFEASLL